MSRISKYRDCKKIDGKKYVKRKRDGKIMHANKEGINRANTKRKIRRQRNSYFES